MLKSGFETTAEGELTRNNDDKENSHNIDHSNQKMKMMTDEEKISEKAILDASHSKNILEKAKKEKPREQFYQTDHSKANPKF